MPRPAFTTRLHRPVIAAEINDRREEGDLRENGGYHAAREEQGQQEARIRQLQDLLNNAKVGEAPKQSGVALPGSVVKVYYNGDKSDSETFLIATRQEGVNDGKLEEAAAQIQQSLAGTWSGVEEELAAAGRVEREGDPALRRVHREPEERALGVLHAAPEGRAAAQPAHSLRPTPSSTMGPRASCGALPSPATPLIPPSSAGTSSRMAPTCASKRRSNATRRRPNASAW